MKLTVSIRCILVLTLGISVTNPMFAQLGFCGGNSGDPIFMETFGSGITNGPPLPFGTTTYSYVDERPYDGSYTISSNTSWFGWHDVEDHTPGDTNGKCFIVNADYTAGEFFRTTIYGLCENTTYEFSSWLINLLPASGCDGNGIPINVKFQIWDDTDTTLLASGDTGDLQATTSPVWEQYALVFTTLSGQTSVILKMINNGTGGCGNDLAIDDIIFKSCGDFISIFNEENEDSVARCENDEAYTTLLTVSPDFSIFSTHFYQWQQSNDGSTWNDVLGETNQTYQTPLLNTTTYFRAKVAEDPINLANDLCNVVSDVFMIEYKPNPNPPISLGDLVVCEDALIPLSVSVNNSEFVDWYDSPNGGDLLATNTDTFQPNISSIYYAEAVSQTSGCTSTSRTALSYRVSSLPVVIDEYVEFCEGETVTLSANVPDMFYLWNTGATTESITINSGGEYSVSVTNSDGCTSTKTIDVVQIDAPIIDNIVSEGSSIVINMMNSGDFEYSLDGNVYQSTPIFQNVSGDYYMIHVREFNGCGIVTKLHLHFIAPKFMTPNDDGDNDTFTLKGIESFSSSEVYIFDRYGKLLKSGKNGPFSWDGTFNNNKLPTGDYWYIVKIDGHEMVGHFTLKR